MSNVLALLDDIGRCHERIADLANRLDWDGVSNEWQATRLKLRELENHPLDQLSGHERSEAAQQIEKLLELEQRISDQIIPWLDQVRPLLESFNEHPIASKQNGTE